METLDQFVKRNRLNKYPHNAYVEEPEWESLYVRYTKHIIDHIPTRTLDLANIEAKNPGQGSFTRLVERILTDYPECAIYVESVQNERFRKKLIKMGFTQIDREWNFYLKSRVL